MCLLLLKRLSLEVLISPTEAVLRVVDVPPEEVVIPPEEAPVMMVPALSQAVEPVGRPASPGDSQEEGEECGHHSPACNWRLSLLTFL